MKGIFQWNHTEFFICQKTSEDLQKSRKQETQIKSYETSSRLLLSTSDKARKRFLGLDKREKWISAIVSNNISINYWGNQLQSTEVHSTKKCLLDFSKPPQTLHHPVKILILEKEERAEKKTLKFTQNAPSLDCFRYTQKHESLSNWKGKNCLENRSDQERQENWRHENFEKGRSRGKFQFSDAKFRDCDSLSSTHR